MADLYGTADNDTIVGTNSADYITGGDGDDLLYGLDGDDTFIPEAGSDTLNGGRGNDLFTHGHTWLGNTNTLVYQFDSGFGNDTVFVSPISESGANLNGLARIILPSTLTLDDVTFSRSGEQEVLMTVNATNDSVRLTGWYDPYCGQLQTRGWNEPQSSNVNIEFANGLVLTQADITEMINGPTAGGDYLIDTRPITDDPIDGIALNGLGGNDTIIGHSFDTINGGAGNDVLIGTYGVGTYTFDSDFGSDTIRSAGANVYLPQDISADNLVIKRLYGASILISFDNRDDSIEFDHVNEYNPGRAFNLNIYFADGSQMTAAQIWDAAKVGTPTDDYLYGTNSAESILGGTGNDHIYGYGGGIQYWVVTGMMA